MSDAPEGSYPCNVPSCSSRLTTEQRLAAHLQVPHTQCGLCGKASIRASLKLDKHHERCPEHPYYSHNPERFALQGPTQDQYGNQYGKDQSRYLGEWQPPTGQLIAVPTPHHGNQQPQQPSAPQQPHLPAQPGHGQYRASDGRIYNIPPNYHLAADGHLYPNGPAR